MNEYSGKSIGRYHILEQLGEGGMAVVYKAFDTNLNCDVAIKFIRSQKLSGDHHQMVLKRFKTEAQKTAALDHPNIVPVLDYGEFEGVPFLVMKYFPGGTLKKALQERTQRNQGPYPYQAAAAILVPIARALETAHRSGIVHRDIKPSNILLTQTGLPMLTDFGVAKVLESDETIDRTSLGTGIGTPEYMAPEQWEGIDIDGRADVYALGITFYEMITGRVPYTADTVPAILIKMLRDPLPRPREFVPVIPEEVERVVFKALAKDKQHRFSDMASFAAALERLSISASKRTEQDSPGKEKPDQKPNEKEPIPLKPHRQPIANLPIVTAIVVLLIFGAVIFLPGLGGNNSPGFSFGPTPEIVKVFVTPTPIYMVWTESPSTAPATTTSSGNQATPTVPEKASLTFQEDFESGKAAEFRPRSGTWTVMDGGAGENGNKVYQASNPSDWEYILTEFGPADFTDGNIQYRFKFLNYDASVNGSGIEFIFFRMKGNWTDDAYTFQLQATNHLADLNYVPPESDAWPGLGYHTVTLGVRRWYTVRVEAKGNDFNVFLDDRLIISGKDDESRSMSGRIGFQVGPQSTVQFDDVQIWQFE
ncbi:MAG: protein kinase [Anaerolineaceae bacterium]|nr:protein kinase [Anaerolineaceae bacterium]